jgi:hypothetical protein
VDQARRELRLVAKVISRYPGEDWFTIYIANGASKVRVHVPDARIRYCPELDRELIGILGAGSITVDRV